MKPIPIGTVCNFAINRGHHLCKVEVMSEPRGSLPMAAALEIQRMRADKEDEKDILEYGEKNMIVVYTCRRLDNASVVLAHSWELTPQN